MCSSDLAILTVVGIYVAVRLPVAVFPTTNFPRVIIGVDNGVMPIEQMELTITRPLEEAVRAVPGLEIGLSSRTQEVHPANCRWPRRAVRHGAREGSARRPVEDRGTAGA